MTPHSNFPTLSLSVLCHSVKDNKSIEANSLHPIPFETDLFRGELLLLLRASNSSKDDALYHDNIFEGKKRTVSHVFSYAMIPVFASWFRYFFDVSHFASFLSYLLA